MLVCHFHSLDLSCGTTRFFSALSISSFFDKGKMSTRIGMDEAIIQLKEMFPTVDEDVIALVLTENGSFIGCDVDHL